MHRFNLSQNSIQVSILQHKCFPFGHFDGMNGFGIFGCPYSYSLWRSAVQLKVLKLEHDPLVLERLELVRALLHVALGVEVDWRPEGPVLRGRARRRDVALITGYMMERERERERERKRGRERKVIISLALCARVHLPLP